MFSVFREKDETSSASNRFILGAHTAPRHSFCLPAIHFYPFSSALLPAEGEQFTRNKESPHSTEGNEFLIYFSFLKCVVVVVVLLHKLCKLQTAFQNKYFLELPRVYIDNIMCIEMSMNFTHTTKILMGMVACLTGDTK